jgi:hypothetical protein
MMTQVYDRNKLLKLAAWAQMSPQKQAFVDPATAAGAMPPSAPPMDPAMAGGDPMMAGGMPPMPPEMMMGGMPAGDPMMAASAVPPPPPSPIDPSMQAMGDQEMIRSIIRDEIQKALGGGEGGVSNGAKKGSGNKFDDALRVLEEKMKEQSKIFVAALRNAGIEIPLADLYGIDKADGSGAGTGTPTAAQPGISETLQTGLGGDAAGSQPGKIASLRQDEQQIAQLTKLAQTKDALKRSALAEPMTQYDPNEADLSYLAGLFM